MRFTICSASVEEINELYKEKTKELVKYLASIDNSELIWGAGNTSLMGICYEEFKNNNRNIIGYTNKKYAYIIPELDKANIELVDTTFDLKKNILYNADVVIYVPGGIGTISEFLSHLEELRSNDVNKLLVLYNMNGYYDKLLDLINYTMEENFTKKEVNNLFKVVNNLEELKAILKGE